MIIYMIYDLQVVEIVDRYDIDCVPEQFKSNKLGYIKDSSYPKNCSRTLKVMLFLFWSLPHSMKIPDLCASFSKFILQFWQIFFLQLMYMLSQVQLSTIYYPKSPDNSQHLANENVDIIIKQFGLRTWGSSVPKGRKKEAAVRKVKWVK